MSSEHENLQKNNPHLDYSLQSLSSKGSARLALGTVQFGLPYGISNTQGQTSYEQAEAMLVAARAAKIDTLDTAIAYGEAESVLGRIGVSGFRIISKVPAIQKSLKAVDDFVVAQVEASLKRLSVSCLGGLMLHAPDELLMPYGKQIVRGLQRAKDKGLVERIGLSVYSPEQLAALIPLLPVEILQIPFNIFDRRFAESGLLQRVAKDGVEVHARSVFLQGLLLMPADHVPEKFSPFSTIFENWHAWLAEQKAGSTPLQLCLAHVASYSGISRIVVGADSPAQLQEIIAAASSKPCRAPSTLVSPVSPLINPSEWSNL